MGSSAGSGLEARAKTAREALDAWVREVVAWHFDPLGRLGSPDDVAAAVAFLAGPEAAYITGETLHVNGGMYMI